MYFRIQNRVYGAITVPNRPELVPHFVPHMRYLRYLYQKYLILRYMECDLILPVPNR